MHVLMIDNTALPCSGPAVTRMPARSILQATIILTVMVICVGSAPAWAARGVVILPFAGPRGEETTERLARELRGIKRVSATKYMRASGRMGAEKAAKSLGVTAVVRGAITRLQGRWAVRVVVRAANGSLLGRQVFPLRGTRVDRSTMRRLVKAVGRMVRARGAGAKAAAPRRRRTASAAKPAAAKPPTQPVDSTPPTAASAPTQPKRNPGFDDGSDYGQGAVVVGDAVDANATAGRDKPRRGQRGLGFAVAGGGGSRQAAPTPSRTVKSQRSTRSRGRNPDAEVRSKRSKPRDGTRQQWQTIVEASAGLALFNRSFEFQQALDNPPTYATPSVIPALAIEAAVYPLASLGTPGLSDLGLAGRFQRTVGLKSATPGAEQLANTLLQMYEIGLTYRWNLLGRLTSPGFRFNVDFGQQFFLIDTPSGVANPLPDITYTYFKPRIAFEWLFFDDSDIRMGATAGGSFLAVLSAGDIEKNDPNAFGKASVLAFDAGLSFRVSYHGVLAHLSGFYRRFSFDFSGCQEGCRTAAGATDAYLGGSLTLGYAY